MADTRMLAFHNNNSGLPERLKSHLNNHISPFLHKVDNGERNGNEGPNILPFSPGQVMAFVLFSWIAAQEGVKKLVLCDGERLLLLTGCSSTLYLQENSKP